MKKTQWAWHFSGELSDCLKRFMIQQFVLQAILSFILAILLLGLPAWNQLQAAKLVLIVEDENAKPVPGMEVIHTDKNGDKATGTYDETAGVYRFGDLVDGAGSVTAYHKRYRLAGVRWYLHTPDTVRIVSVKGGYLLFEDQESTYWFKSDNRIAYIAPHRSFVDSGLQDTLVKFGFRSLNHDHLFELQSGKIMDPFCSNELQLARSCKLTCTAGVVAYLEKRIPHDIRLAVVKGARTAEARVLTNEFEVNIGISQGLYILDPKRAKTIDSLMLQYGLYLNPKESIGRNEQGEIVFDNQLHYNFSVFRLACKGGFGSCIIDQARFIADCPYFNNVILKTYGSDEGHLD